MKLLLLFLITISCSTAYCQNKSKHRYFFVGYSVFNEKGEGRGAGNAYCDVDDFKKDTIVALIKNANKLPKQYQIVIIGMFEFKSLREQLNFDPATKNKQ